MPALKLTSSPRKRRVPTYRSHSWWSSPDASDRRKRRPYNEGIARSKSIIYSIDKSSRGRREAAACRCDNADGSLQAGVTGRYEGDVFAIDRYRQPRKRGDAEAGGHQCQQRSRVLYISRSSW
jgi:hypothetical protein